jgi:hypothetical protein
MCPSKLFQPRKKNPTFVGTSQRPLYPIPSHISSSTRPSRNLQPKHTPRQTLRINAQLKIQQKAQRNLQIQQLRGTNTAHLSHALLTPLIIFQRFRGNPDRRQRQSVNSPVGHWQYSLHYAQAVDIVGSREVDAGAVRAVGVLAREVRGDGEGRRAFGEEAACYRRVLDVVGVCVGADVRLRLRGRGFVRAFVVSWCRGAGDRWSWRDVGGGFGESLEGFLQGS